MDIALAASGQSLALLVLPALVLAAILLVHVAFNGSKAIQIPQDDTYLLQSKLVGPGHYG